MTVASVVADGSGGATDAERDGCNDGGRSSVVGRATDADRDGGKGGPAPRDVGRLGVTSRPIGGGSFAKRPDFREASGCVFVSFSSWTRARTREGILEVVAADTGRERPPCELMSKASLASTE